MPLPPPTPFAEGRDPEEEFPGGCPDMTAFLNDDGIYKGHMAKDMI